MHLLALDKVLQNTIALLQVLQFDQPLRLTTDSSDIERCPFGGSNYHNESPILPIRMAYSSKTITYSVSHVMKSQIRLMQQLVLQSPTFSLNPDYHTRALCVTTSPIYLLTLLRVVHKKHKPMSSAHPTQL